MNPASSQRPPFPPRHNRLLAALKEDDYQRLLPHLERMPLSLGASIYESGADMPYAIFPTSGIISLLAKTLSGRSCELAVTGSDGVVGLAMVMGGMSRTNRAVVQSAGQAYRVRVTVLIEEIDRSPDLQRLLLRFTQALITQMAQTAVCNRLHNIDQQLCRWLLLSLDQLPGDTLEMTQGLIADMLGVRREGVSEAASALQDAQLISYRRGQITVLDRAGVEKRACECYRVVKRETDRLFPKT